MSRLSGDQVLVAEQGSDVRRQGRTYRVKDVLSRWHLCDRWGNDSVSASSAASDGCKSDRQYYQLACSSGLLCAVYIDTAVQWTPRFSWLRDRVHD